MQQAIDALLVSVPLPEPALVYTYECELKSDFSLVPEQLARSKPALQRYKDHVLHATLLDNNQTLEIRPLQITASEDELPCIRIRYSIPIISTVVFTTTAAAGLLCWVLSQNGLLVRHSLENAFSNRPLEQWTRTTPVESIADKHFVCMSVTSSGVATIGCEDGTVVHVQDLEQQKAPASSIHFHIVRQGDHFCEFQLRHSTTFAPLLVLQRVGNYVGWRLDSVLEEPSSVSRLSSLTSANVRLSKDSYTSLTAALRKDNRINMWSWTNGPRWSAAQVQRVVELPCFDVAGTLIDPHDQDMTYQLPGSFRPAPLRTSSSKVLFGSASLYSDETNFVYLLPHSDGRCKLLVYIEAAESPFVAVYDVQLNRSGHIDLVILTDIVTNPPPPSRKKQQQYLELSASLCSRNGDQETLDIWIVSEGASGLQVSCTCIPLHEPGMKGPRIIHPTWRVSEARPSKLSTTALTSIVEGKDILVSVANNIFALRDLDAVEIAYHQSKRFGISNASYGAHSDEPSYVPPSVLHMDSKQYQGLCYMFEAIAPVTKVLNQENVRRTIIDTLNKHLSDQQSAVKAIYENVAKDISALEDIESINEDAVKMVVENFSSKIEIAHGTESGKVTEALALNAVRDILQTRFDTTASLVLLLSHHIHKCGQKSLQQLADSAVDTLRTYSALLWLSDNESREEDDNDSSSSNTYPPAAAAAASSSTTSILQILAQNPYPITVNSERKLDIGSAAYAYISRMGAHDSDILIDVCDKLASLGLTHTGLEFAQRHLDTTASEKKGHHADVLRSITFWEQFYHLKLKEASRTLQDIQDPQVQKRLVQKLIDTAFARKEYEIICQLSVQQSLQCQVDDLLLQRAEEEKDIASGEKSWWQICYSFYTFSGDHEQANKCMLRYLAKTKSQDPLLEQFFNQQQQE